MLKQKGSRWRRYGTGCGSCAFWPGTMKGASASNGTTHGEMVVPRFFDVNGPSGWYSNSCMSRALQSLSSTNPSEQKNEQEYGLYSKSIAERQRPICTAFKNICTAYKSKNLCAAYAYGYNFL